MHFSLSTLALLALGASQAAALGINCRGSSKRAASSDSMGAIANAMDRVIAAGQGGKMFTTGQRSAPAQLACSRSQVCAFWQFGSASGTMQSGRNYVTLLQNHNCVNCGSVPLAAGNPDISTGALTVNYVSSHCCIPQGTGTGCSC